MYKHLLKLKLGGGEDRNLKVGIHLAAHVNALYLSDDSVNGKQHLGALCQMSAVAAAGTVAHIKMYVQVYVALIIVADDAGRVGQLDRSGEMKDLAVAVACLGGNRYGVAVFNNCQAADSAEDNTVLDAGLFAGLGKTEKNVCSGLESENHYLAEFALCHLDQVFHSFFLLLIILTSIGSFVKM